MQSREVTSKFNKEEPDTKDCPLIYLSSQFSYPGREKTLEWIRRTGCTRQCFSFAFITEAGFFFSKGLKAQYEIAKECGLGIMIDSSAFQFRRFLVKATSGSFKSKFAMLGKKGDELRDDVVKAYIAFCKDQAHQWDFYIGFDYVRDARKVYAMQKYLERQWLRPVPVFHGDSGVEWLQRYIDDGHRLIGIGAARRGRKGYLDAVFDLAAKHNVKMHGFARTSVQDILNYPWFSVDSTTWIKASAYGKVIIPIPEENVCAQLHISVRRSTQVGSLHAMEPSVKKVLREIVESYGFDFELLQNSLHERTCYNGYILSNFSKLGFKVGNVMESWGKVC